MEMINSVGDSGLASGFKSWVEGAEWPAQEKPWEWYPVTKHMRFEQGIQLLKKLNDPALWTVQRMPGFENVAAIARAIRQPKVATVHSGALNVARALRAGAIQRRRPTVARGGGRGLLVETEG
jgi:hypothetical protein